MPDFLQANLWSMVTMAIVIGGLVPIVAILTDHQRQSRQDEWDNRLKHDLLTQGKSPEEVMEILEATSQRKR